MMHVEPIPSWQLYGEAIAFPDVLHVERIVDRAAGLDWTIRPHRHPHLHQFFLLTEGDVRLDVDGAPLAPVLPVVLSIPPGMVHSFVFSRGTEGVVVTLPVQEVPQVFTDPALAPALSRLLHGPADAALIDRFHDLAAAHAGDGSLRRIRLQAMALTLACLVVEGSAGDPAARIDPRVRQFQSLVLAHFREQRGLAFYANRLGLSPRHLTRLCREATGHAPGQLIERAVLQEACRLLAYTRMSSAAVGYALGYDDPSYFSRVFHRHQGQSPGAYRAQFDRRPAGAVPETDFADGPDT